MTKVVINACYGGFSLSEEGIKEYARLKGWQLFKIEDTYTDMYWIVPETHEERMFYEKHKNNLGNLDSRTSRIMSDISEKYIINCYHDYDRADPVLVEVVEKLGKRASGSCAKLVIEDIPPGTLYRITEYDGFEGIETKENLDWKVA